MILYIDTITPKANVTLLKNGQSLGVKHFDPYQASENTLVSIDELLTKNNASIQGLTGVVLISGPGGFTGLRVGLAVANTLIDQLQLKALNLTTDEWWQHGLKKEDWVYVQSMNRSEVYAVGFGDYVDRFNGIIAIEALPKDLVWSGILSDLHREKLNLGQELTLADVDQVWLKAVEENQDNFKKGKLIEAFYLKKPNITPAKSK